MGISETIMAASIGAAATVTTALFQLYTALRTGKADQRRKKANMLKSTAAIAALMIASAAGGYVFAEYRQQRALEDVHAVREELRGLRDELNARLGMLTQKAEEIARERGTEELPADTEAMVLARGPVDRACDALDGERASVCDAALEPTSTAPAVAPPAEGADR
jgi:flagellar motility protein MotE (MotC chaperone)